MNKKNKRKIFIDIRRMLPRRLRSIENFYFFSFCISAVFWLVIMIPLLLHVGLYRPAWSSAVCAVLISSLLFLWRGGISLILLQILFQAILLWIIIYNAYHTGGITSPLMVWLGIVPILPLFTISRRSGYISLIISFLLVVAVYFFQINGWIPIKEGNTMQDLTLSVLMIALLCVTLLMLVITYDSVNSQQIRTIETKNIALKKLSTQLKTADKHKDNFLATVSHEMRTPLNALMGYLGLLRSMENLPGKIAQYVEGAQSSAAHLLTVINDLLDFSQIQRGKLVLSNQSVDLYQIIKETHKTLEPKAVMDSINYKLIIDQKVPRWIKIDPHRFAQIYLNLLGNALKFTPQGDVITHVCFESIKDQEPSQGSLVLQVQDTGIGIPQSFFEHIFEPFSQLPSQYQSDSSLRGNGLGLSITKKLVTTMGGSITLDSQVGVGSVFEVKLPVSIVTEPLHIQPIQKSSVHLNSIYILLVDDHATNRLVTSATIQQDLPNARIDQARNGAEAIEKMKANLYDVVLMDMIMPDYSGIEVTRIIRAECVAPFSMVKVVALTANVAETLTQDCASVGISEILRKPFERSILIRTIMQHATS
jgi:signal transduction histidine kinase/ActR/RegA family two-component response regulator